MLYCSYAHFIAIYCLGVSNALIAVHCGVHIVITRL